MSLSFNDMYSITAGIHLAFTSKTNNRLLTVNHRKKKREQMQKVFPENKFSEWTKENFIVANLYLNFSKSPSSLVSSIEMLRDVNKKEVYGFKDKIVNYRKYLRDDIERIRTEEGANPGLPYMIDEYRNNKIQWYTFYFYLIVSGADLETLKRSRLNGFLLKKIQKLLLYVTFSEKSMLTVKEIMKDTIDI